MSKEITNKRIYELYKSMNRQVLTADRVYINQPTDIEKFAELIIKECIECGNNLANHYINKHFEQEHTFLLAAIADYSNEIKKHFGVTHD